MTNTTQSQRLFNDAQQVLVGGVNSPVRAFKSVGGTPIFAKSGNGAYLTCEDDQRYIDYVLSYGPLISGHAHPDVVDVITKTAQNGCTFGAPTQLETQLAVQIKKTYNYIDKIRFVSSGTEATMSAIRLARGVTKRSIIVKFEGCYHGHADALLVAAGSGAATLGVPDSDGVLSDLVKHTAVLPYNNTEALTTFFQEHGDNIAGIIIEPVAGNMGLIPAEPAFIQACRTACNSVNACLIFDEVMCGYRSQHGSTHIWIGCTPDIVVLGKVIGGGLPCGAYGANAQLMNHIAPEGPVYQAGTLSGNPLAMAAGLKTLQLLENSETFNALETQTQALAKGIKDIAASKNRAVQVQQRGSMFTVFFSQNPVQNYTDAQNCDHQAFTRYFHAMLKNGIYLPPSQYETCFTSIMHGPAHIQATLEAVEKSL